MHRSPYRKNICGTVACEIKPDSCCCELQFIQLARRVRMNTTDSADSIRTFTTHNTTLCWHFYRTCLGISHKLIHRIFVEFVCVTLSSVEVRRGHGNYPLSNTPTTPNWKCTPAGRRSRNVSDVGLLIYAAQGSTFPVVAHSRCLCYVNGAPRIYMATNTHSILSERAAAAGWWYLY